MDKRRRRQQTLIDRVRREIVSRRIHLRGQGMAPQDIAIALAPMRGLLASLSCDLETPHTTLH